MSSELEKLKAFLTGAQEELRRLEAKEKKAKKETRINTAPALAKRLQVINRKSK